ncbi:YggS family pyridoxal phosphate-dependent enzyme [Psychromonas sp. psych-6C06]|uniref:YggS family pyridoxal phosphate-dependent enzyme n=1 Tax=Psychromonas sp. psych-6C06 TaxID=2058089 RepID=UPI000C34F308|nr:YggS family pyridoxal phosphate-dependent enzyme [Psychromonas sp. psych-6C06]PKF63090.1 YggS family pyridoxal phosphate-dependent enzyme [Psychromonas sp. psych-6C06]
MTNIQKQINNVTQKIAYAATQVQRNAHEIQLLAVSKTKPVSLIKEAYLAGLRHFGENYVQESVEKIQQIKLDNDFNEPTYWYFIGPLQSNKTRAVAENFDWVQSVERLKIAQRLNDQRPNHLQQLNICLQVNISGEASKSGTTLSQVIELASQVSDLPRLKLRGIMAIPEKTENIERLEKQFNELHNIYNKLQTLYPEVDTLSMGMSGDLQSAIKCGSTMVRIGTDIFGARD